MNTEYEFACTPIISNASLIGMPVEKYQDEHKKLKEYISSREYEGVEVEGSSLITDFTGVFERYSAILKRIESSYGDIEKAKGYGLDISDYELQITSAKNKLNLFLFDEADEILHSIENVLS